MEKRTIEHSDDTYSGPKYNTMFDVAFSVEHDFDDPHNVPVAALIEGLNRRLTYLIAHPQEAREAIDVANTYEKEDK